MLFKYSTKQDAELNPNLFKIGFGFKKSDGTEIQSDFFQVVP